MASEMKKGDFANFNGYGADVLADKNFEPILEKGQRVVIDNVNDDGGFVVFAVDEEGEYLKDGDDKPIGETLFPEELTAEIEGEVEEAGETGTNDMTAADVTEDNSKDETTEIAEAAEAAAKAEAKAPKRSAGKGGKASETAKAPTAAEKKAAKEAEKKATADAKQKAKDDAKEKAKAEKEASKKAEADAKAKAKEDAKSKLATGTSESDDPLMINVEQTQTVKTILADQDALQAAKMLVSRAEQTDFTLGGVLHHVYVTGAFKQIGYDGKRGFSDYVEKELGVQYRKARYLMAIYTTFAQVFRAKGITEDDLLKLGWSKAKELARIPVNKLVEDYDDLMAMANDPEKSRDELIGHIKDHYEVVQRAERVAAVTITFKLVADAAETVKNALAHAKTMAGDNADDNAALEYMAGDWMNTAAGTGTTLDQLKALALAQFGVTLVEAEASEEAAGEGSEEATEEAA